MNTTSDSFDEWAAARSAGWFRLFGWILGFRSLRSLHPRLYAAVRFAHSFVRREPAEWAIALAKKPVSNVS